MIPIEPNLNLLLAALTKADLAPWPEELESVSLRLGDMLYEPGVPLQHAYFPTTAIISLHYVTATGASCETAGVGNEGVVGMALFLGGGTTLGAGVVQTAGHAFRVSRRIAMRDFEHGTALRRILLRYVMGLLTQTAQGAACNRHHSIDQGLARWLLSTLDRLPRGELVMTQELIGKMLGVRREGITDAAGRLQRAGVITCRRGHITVIDRAALEKQACECYQVIKGEMARLRRDVDGFTR